MSDDGVIPAPPWHENGERWPWKQPRPKPKVKEPLSLDRIVDAAMKIVDHAGLDALSMRRLGDELQTTASALYAHVADKDELLDLMFDRVMGEVELPDPDPDDWQEQLKQYARESVRVLVGHRDLAKITIGRVPFGPNGIRTIEQMLALLRSGGLPDRIAAYAGDLLGSYLGVMAIEQAMRREQADNGEDTDLATITAQMRTYMESLPAEHFPNIVALAGPLTEGGTDDRFELGLDIIVRGLSSYVEKDRG
ncbi:TetR/AcrR family transcriptional regulator [Nocardia stercoris]|nr:TetR/AcrR family transcriptional regulator [Nocardia stercoris]